MEPDQQERGDGMGIENTETINAATTIRRLDLTDADHEAVARLAERDSARSLEGPVLGLEVEGSLVAATSLTNGRTIADPFSRSDELRSLLELRASQLRRRGWRRGAGRFGRRRRRPAVGGGPPGHLGPLPRAL
jgi:hypothetical protein